MERLKGELGSLEFRRTRLEIQIWEGQHVNETG